MLGGPVTWNEAVGALETRGSILSPSFLAFSPLLMPLKAPARPGSHVLHGRIFGGWQRKAVAGVHRVYMGCVVIPVSQIISL